jgi:FdhD protein
MLSTTGVTEWCEGEFKAIDDYLAGEEPLEISVQAPAAGSGEAALSAGRPLTVTMRTPGHDLELAAGFLFTEGLISSRAQIASICYAGQDEPAGRGNRVLVELAPGAELDADAAQRNFYSTSSCGVCGKASLEAIRVRGIKRLPAGPLVAPELLCKLPDKLREGQAVFGRTGGLHAAALFSASGKLLALREDIGRHNAVDKVIGWALGNDMIPLRTAILMVSGRGGFEIIQKALVAGIPLLASVSAPSDLAVKLAREFGMTLVGFLRGRRFVIYSGAERLSAAEAE